MVLRKIQDIPSEHFHSHSGPDSGSTAIRNPTMTSGGTGAAHNIPAPPNRPASPSGSLYAMSDDEEGEYNTITHQESGKGVKLLFSKSKVCHELPYKKAKSLGSTQQRADYLHKVYIHPTPSSKDNIPGFIALLQQKPPTGGRPVSSDSSDPHSIASSDLLLAWIPETQLGEAASVYVKVDLSEGDSPPKQTYLVPPIPTVTTHRGSVGHYSFAIPVSAIYSLLVRPPSMGWWFGSFIINSRAGDSFPALFFHDSECESTILQKKKHMKDKFDPFGESGQMFWGGDEVLRWLRRYVKIERSVAEPNIYLVEPSKEDSEGFGSRPTASTPSSIGRQDSTKGIKIGGAAGTGNSGAGSSRDAQMDPFTKFVKETGWNIMEKFSKVTTFTRNAANEVIDNPRVPPQVRSLLRNPEVKTLQDEFDSARVYLARWAMSIAEQSERDRRQRVWTAQDIMEMEDTDVGEFELLEASSLSLEEVRKSVTMKEWQTFFDPTTGRLSVTVDEVKERIFHGGLDPDDGVRKEAWLFLLGVHDWHSTEVERRAHIASLRDAFLKLKGAWWERLDGLGGEGEEGEWWREQRSRIGKNHSPTLFFTLPVVLTF